MSQTAQANSSATAAPADPVTPKEIDSRFGRLSYTLASVFSFTRGLLGMTHLHDFALAVPGIEALKGFHALQSLEDPATCLLCMSLEPFDLIAQTDLGTACAELDLDLKQVGVFGIVSIRGNDEPELDFTVNLRGPLLLDFSKKEAHQYVMRNSDYDIRYPLSSLIRG